MVSAPVAIIQRNPVLNMLLQHALAEQGQAVVLKEDRVDFDMLLRYLANEPVDLASRELAELIKLLLCGHRFQCYGLLSDILRELTRFQSPEYILRIFMVLRRLPELPEMGDPSAPSAPPETDLCDVDPEQATFRAQLKDTYQRCLQVIDKRIVEVLNSDAALSLDLESLEELAQRSTLNASELGIGLGVLRRIRNHRFTVHSSGGGDEGSEQCRALVLGSVRLLTMKPKDLKKLNLESEGILQREELEAVLRLAHHGSGTLPDHLEPYRSYWQTPRAADSTAGRVRRFVERKIGAGIVTTQDVADSAERREAVRQKRNQRLDKVKMAVAHGASLIFD